MIRKVSVKVDTKSILDRCEGILRFSKACRTAFRVLADDDWSRTSRVSLLTVYWIEAPTTNRDTSRKARNCESQSPENPSCGTIVETYCDVRQSGKGYYFVDTQLVYAPKPYIESWIGCNY